MILILRRKNLGRGSTRSIKALSKHKDKIKIRKSEQKFPKKIDLLVRWGTTTIIPNYKGLVLNKAEAINICANKKLTRTLLNESGVPVPKMYNNVEDIKFPCILRPSHHSQGKNLYFCTDQNKLYISRLKLFGKDTYLSEYINKDREFGIFIFDGKITSVVEKETINKDAIAWNVAQGNSKFVNVKWNDWPLEACKIAIDAIKVIGLDFGRVDIIQKENKYYVLELNSAHSLTSPYRKKCFALALDYFYEKGRIPKNKFTRYKTYRYFIHPAMFNSGESVEE
jgi:glutathione synthase/RimK-type ligase-like ATP-grasp enzyme